jgi:rhodanese-related sulfurtransferase
VPVEGELPGTDLFVAYDQIDEATELPKDRAAPIAVYCLTGSMSRQAGQALTELWGQSIRSRTGL